MHLLDADFPLSKPAPSARDTGRRRPLRGELRLRAGGHPARSPGRAAVTFEQLTGQGKAELFSKTPTLFYLKVVDAQISFEDEKDRQVRSHWSSSRTDATSEPCGWTPPRRSRSSKTRIAIAIKPEVGRPVRRPV